MGSLWVVCALRLLKVVFKGSGFMTFGLGGLNFGISGEAAQGANSIEELSGAQTVLVVEEPKLQSPEP